MRTYTHIFFFRKVRMYFSALRACWQPPKRSYKTKSQYKESNNNYTDPKKSTNCSSLSIPSSLHQENKVLIHFL
uniref:Putative ovule protein n=1 Tax=Solanum chacoense TaxID=4108 RepID=A0A0V0HMM0_SOLCH